MDCENELKSRHENNIYTLKVLDTDGNRIVVRNALDPPTCISIIAPNSYYERNTYVDMAFSNQNEVFNAKLVGVTPLKFVPTSEEDIL